MLVQPINLKTLSGKYASLGIVSEVIIQSTPTMTPLAMSSGYHKSNHGGSYEVEAGRRSSDNDIGGAFIMCTW